MGRRARRPSRRTARPPRPLSSASAAAARAAAASGCNPPSTSSSAHSASVTSSRRGSRAAPVRWSIDSRTSTALPAVRPSTWFMSVSSATVGSPLPTATSTIARASSRARSSAGINAPEPNLTSMTSASRPAASFLDRIEPTISGIDSTVPVASRIAYSRRSAGARRAVWPTIAQPTRATAARRRSGSSVDVVARDRLELVERAARVPEPAPGDHRHGRAARGDDRREQQAHLVAHAAGRVLVEHRAGQAGLDQSSTSPERVIAPVSATRSAAVIPRQKIAIASAPTCASVTRPVGDPENELGDLLDPPARRRRACGG